MNISDKKRGYAELTYPQKYADIKIVISFYLTTASLSIFSTLWSPSSITIL